MNKSIDLATIVSEAQQGRQDSLELLVTHVRPRVMVYLYRMTLDYHLAQDLTQETMLALVKSLQYLRTDSASSVWAWIYRTALGKGQHHFQKQRRRQRIRPMMVDHDALDQLKTDSTRDGLDQAQRRELIEAMGESLEALKITYRHVLVLRCFEQLSFAEIAGVLGTGSELRMRLLFLRAKRALERQLHNRGFGRKYFLSGLTLFAMITTLETKSAAAVPAATAPLVSPGPMATAIDLLTAPSGIAALTVAVLTLTVGSVFVRGSNAHIPTIRENVPLGSPSGIVNAHDPNGAGWQRLIPFDDRPALRVPLDLNTIVDRPGENFFLILPATRWIEFGFGGGLVNGPGPDIEYYCLKTETLPPVFLTDGDQQSWRLQHGTSELLQDWAYRVLFDLANCKCPFTPTAIRIEAPDPPPREPIVLINVNARTAATDNAPSAARP